MTGPWQTLRRVFVEAKSALDYKNALLKLITRRFGENEAEEVEADLKRMGFKQWRHHMAYKYMSDEIDGLIKNMGAAALAAHRARQGGDKKPEQPTTGGVKGPSGRQFLSADDAAEKQAKIDAMKAARQGVGQSDAGASKVLMTPGKGGPSAMGNAGQLQVKDQPSQSQGFQPQQGQQPRSGLVAAQRQVDKLTKEKGAKEGDRLAASLGVPTTAERTVEDEISGEPHVQIWSPDRVMRFMDADQRSGSKFKGSSDELPAFLRGAYKSAQKTGGISMGAEPRKTAEPMSRADLIKMGALQRNKAAAPGQMGPSRPPSFDGEVWKPHGREGERNVSRPDKATGNWIRGKQVVDPKHTGQELVGLNGKWVLPSVYAAQKGADHAAGKKDDDGGEEGAA